MASGFGVASTATSDVFPCEAECKKAIIIDFAQPRSYPLLGRIVFGLNQSTNEARSAFRAFGIDVRCPVFYFHGGSIQCCSRLLLRG
jgi:hypothetical protein